MTHRKSVVHVVMATCRHPDEEYPDYPVCFYRDPEEAAKHAEMATQIVWQPMESSEIVSQDSLATDRSRREKFDPNWGPGKPARYYWGFRVAQGEAISQSDLIAEVIADKRPDRDDRELDSLDRQTLVRFVQRVESSSLRSEASQGEMIARLLSGSLSGDDREDLARLSSSEAFEDASPRTCEALRRTLDALSS
jgi:hypothetical protein